MWAAWDCDLTAVRDVLGLDVPVYQKYQAWERAAIEGGFRMVHKEFCMVSDFPEFIYQDDQHRSHCATGPSHRWRDGWSLHYWHGVRVPAWAVEQPAATVTLAQILGEDNQEVRRAVIERIGWERFLELAHGTVIHVDELTTQLPTVPVSELVAEHQRLVVTYRAGTEHAELIQVDAITDFDGNPLKFVRVTDPSTGRQYVIRVAANTTRAYQGVASTFGCTEVAYKTGAYIRQGDVFLKPLSGNLNQQEHS